MANEWNNVKPVGCKPWLVLPAVYSDALSYGEQIAHFCAALNKLIQNNNTLPEYIQQMIQDYINGDVIGEVVQNIVSQFILNVKYPPENLKPAVGDGSADDTEAIQGCINYAKNHNGMAVYIPSGAYSVQSLTLPGDVSLFGFDRYTTKLVLRGGATKPMISSTGTGFSIIGLTLDGNAGVQVENINILSLISQDVLLKNLIIQNGYKLLVYNGTGGNLQVNDVVFGNAVYDCAEISGGSIVQFDNCLFTTLSQVGGQHVIDISSDGGVYNFINTAVCPVCCVVSGDDNAITFSSTGAQDNYTDTGMRNNIRVEGQEAKEYLSGNFDSTIEGSYGQSVNGAYSENISGNFTSVRNGSESKTVTDQSTENYSAGKNITIAQNKNETVEENSTESVAGKKTINATTLDLNPTNPIMYSETAEINKYFKGVEWQDRNGDSYTVLVQTAETARLDTTAINVDNYGARGDGVTDDTNYIAAAFNAANSVGLPVEFTGNKTYVLRYANIPVKVPVNFNGATIKISTNMPAENLAVFVVSADNPTNKVITNSQFTNTAVSDSSLYDSVFEIVSPMLLGTRTEGTENIYYTQLMVTDKIGKFINTTYKPTIPTGNYSINNAHKVGKLIELKNVTVDYGESVTSMGRLFEITRSNVTIDGVNISGRISPTLDRFMTSVINIEACAFITIKNVHGSNPVVGNSSGYILGVYNCSNVNVIDCNLSDNNQTTWGSIGISFITNFFARGVITNRFDIHYASVGYYTIQDSVTQYARTTLNYDTQTYERVKFLGYAGNYSTVDVRQDYGVPLGGNYLFKECAFFNDTEGNYISFSLAGTPQASVSDLNVEPLNVTLDNITCEPGNPVRQIIRFNLSSALFKEANCFIRNCTIDTNAHTGFSAYIHAQKHINNVVVYGCDIYGRVVDGDIDTVKISDCILGPNPIRNVENSTISNVAYIDCVIANIESTIYYDTFTLIGCQLQFDKAVTFNGTNRALYGNTMIGNTKANLSAWNNVIA